MSEYFVVAHSFAAPFVSDESTRFVEAESPKEAAEKFAASYKHPAGLYAANVYASADSYHKDGPILARWRSNQSIAVEGATSIYGHGPGDVEIDGNPTRIENPKDGHVIPESER